MKKTLLTSLFLITGVTNAALASHDVNEDDKKHSASQLTQDPNLASMNDGEGWQTGSHLLNTVLNQTGSFLDSSILPSAKRAAEFYGHHLAELIKDPKEYVADKILGLRVPVSAPAAVSIDNLPQDVMAEIFRQTCDSVKPRCLTSICKSWRSSLGLVRFYEGGLYYSDMPNVMKNCMHTFWTNQFDNGVLSYTTKYRNMGWKFSDLNDLSVNECTDITTNMDHFFKMDSEKNKILIVLHHMVAEKIQPDHPFTSIMASWDPEKKAPVGVFIRQHKAKNLTDIHYLIPEDLHQLSLWNLEEYWNQFQWLGTGENLAPVIGFKAVLRALIVNFVNQSE